MSLFLYWTQKKENLCGAYRVIVINWGVANILFLFQTSLPTKMSIINEQISLQGKHFHITTVSIEVTLEDISFFY